MGARSTAPETGTVIVPASSANLGCGFDCLAVALRLYLRARARWGGRRLELVYRGAHAERVPLDRRSRLLQALAQTARALGRPCPRGRIEVSSEIPVGVGLGSSAAATLAGILLGCEACGREPEEEFVLPLAARIEGHPDNVAAAWRGGLVAVCPHDGGLHVERIAVPEWLEFVAVIPDRPLPTVQARAVLPQRYGRAQVVATLQRLAVVVASCFSGRFELTPELFADRLHQPYRTRLIAGLEEGLNWRTPDLDGVYLSGAGPALVALTQSNGERLGQQLAALLRRHGIAAEVRRLKADNGGLRHSLSAACPVA